MQGDPVSGMRQQYFIELIRDAREVCKQTEIAPEDQGLVIAALVFSDSLNGIRKAMLTPTWLMAPRNPAQS